MLIGRRRSDELQLHDLGGIALIAAADSRVHNDVRFLSVMGTYFDMVDLVNAIDSTADMELLSAVATQGFTELLDRRTRLPDGGPRERLTAACHSYVDFALRNPAMFELMFRLPRGIRDEDAIARAAGEQLELVDLRYDPALRQWSFP